MYFAYQTSITYNQTKKLYNQSYILVVKIVVEFFILEKNNLFKQASRDKQDIIFDDLTYKIGSIGVEALNTLYDLMKNATNENNKIKASMFIIDKLFQIKENDTIRKIEEIEYALQGGIRK